MSNSLGIVYSDVVALMKKRYRRVFICFLLGIALFCFGQSAYIQAKAYLAQHLIASAWAKTLDINADSQGLLSPVMPWSWADTYPVMKLTVPHLDIQQYVLAGANGAPLAFGPGWYGGTRLPNDRNSLLPDTVIAGHHDTHFSFLKRLHQGDTVGIETPQGKLIAYQVSDISYYDIRNSRLPSYHSGRSLQLVTCAPSYLGDIHPNQRLVVKLIKVNKTQITAAL